jgi:hypothetical protein
MRLNQVRHPVLLALGCLAVLLLSQRFALTQQSDPLNVGLPVTIIRKAKSTRKSPETSKGVERVPLLKLEWRLLRVSRDGSEEEVSPMQGFRAGERLRISVRANQDGYLYVVHQRSATSDGRLIFPDLQLNNGSSSIGSSEIVLPSNCPSDVERRDCALILSRSNGTELLHLFFSRDPYKELPLTVYETPEKISAETLLKLKSESTQTLRRQKGSTPLSELLTNINTRDNEEIVETLELQKP